MIVRVIVHYSLIIDTTQLPRAENNKTFSSLLQHFNYFAAKTLLLFYL